jgi:L-malate glycosyltransferase
VEPKCRVLWAIKGLGLGGAEQLLVQLAQSLDHGAFEIHCAYTSPGRADLAVALDASGVRCTALGGGGRPGAGPAALVRHIRRGGYDVVHSHSPSLAAVARLACLARPTTHVATIHNVWPEHHRLTRGAVLATAGLDHTTLAVSARVRRSLPGRIRQRARVQIQGIDLRRIPDRVAVAQPSTSGRLRLITVANFRPSKDHQTLLQAAACLRDRGTSFELAVVGGGDAALRAHAEATCDRLGLRAHVSFLGQRADAVDLMVGADVYVVASAWEGGPISAMEAAALGLPIVSTRVGVMDEAFTDGIDCLLVPPQDPGSLAAAIEALASDPDRRRALGRGARATSARFDIRRVAEELETIYRDAWAAGRGGR